MWHGGLLPDMKSGRSAASGLPSTLFSPLAKAHANPLTWTTSSTGAPLTPSNVANLFATFFGFTPGNFYSINTSYTCPTEGTASNGIIVITGLSCLIKNTEMPILTEKIKVLELLDNEGIPLTIIQENDSSCLFLKYRFNYGSQLAAPLKSYFKNSPYPQSLNHHHPNLFLFKLAIINQGNKFLHFGSQHGDKSAILLKLNYAYIIAAEFTLFTT